MSMNCLGTYDAVFISYRELNAEEHYAQALQKMPWCQRLHGIEGMANAYRRSAEIARTPFYFLIDGDSLLLNEFNTDEIRPIASSQDLLVWQTINAVNGLVYGYGGIKLVGADVMRNIDESKLDFIAGDGIKVKFMKEVASITAFNCSPFGAWKAGFRECCMLSHADRFRTGEERAAQRLRTWCTCGADKPYGSWAIKGALDGVSFFKEYEMDPSALQKINDSQWLEDEFHRRYRENVC